MIRSTTMGNNITANNYQKANGAMLPFSKKQAQVEKSTKKSSWKFWKK